MSNARLNTEQRTITDADVLGLLSGAAPPPYPQTEVGVPPRRRRRARVAVPLPEAAKSLDPEEVSRLRNRLAAKRSRDRAAQRTADLEEMVRELWKRVQYLEALVVTLRPDRSELYSQYEPYYVSHSLPAQGSEPARAVDMTELSWVLDADADAGTASDDGQIA